MKSVIKLNELSVFFPAYNEAGNIGELLKQAISIIPSIAKKYEIIVIDDGSTDATASIVSRLAKKHPSIRLITQSNQGYGGALKRGFSESRYEWIFFTDSDLQFDLNEITHFIASTDQHRVIIGYRKNRAEGWWRNLLAKSLKIVGRIWFGFPTQIKDIDCAYKLIHRDVIGSTLPLYSDGAMISTELLLKIHRLRCGYLQLPVTHFVRHVGTSTGSSFRVISKAFIDLFALKLHLLREKCTQSLVIVLNWKKAVA